AEAYDEATERHQREVCPLSLKVDALRSQSDATEKLLAEMRSSLAAQSEEIRAAEAKLLEANAARGRAEKKAEKYAAGVAGWEHQTKKLKDINDELTERCRSLTATLATSEGWVLQANAKIQKLTNLLHDLQMEAATSRSKYDDYFIQPPAT